MANWPKSAIVGVMTPVIAAIIVFALLAGEARAQAGPPTTLPSRCQIVQVPVALTYSGEANNQVTGYLCQPPGKQRGLVQLAIPGATYDKTYWDFPYQPDTYSYVRYMVSAGYAVFTVDRLGTGLSSHPLSALVTRETDAFTISQVVQKLRQLGFGKVVIVGHSLGSQVGALATATFGGVDGIVLSGFSHHANTLSIAPVVAQFLPAALDPKFANAGYDPGYLSVKSHDVAAFYAPETSDAGAKARDTETRSILASTELTEIFAQSYGLIDPTPLLRVPVFLINGEKDGVFCGGGTTCTNGATLAASEKPYFPNVPCFSVQVIPATGHNLNTSTTAQTSFAGMRWWIDTHFGVDGINPPNCSPSP